MSIFERILSGKFRYEEPQIPAGLVVYAIGDIHGRADLLAKLLVEIDRDRTGSGREVHLIFLGDYVDRGDDSRTVVDRLIEIGSDDRIKSTFLMGNHEDAMLRFLDAPKENADWLSFGGLSTLMSYGVGYPGSPANSEGLQDCANALRAALPMSHHRFLERLRLSERIGQYFFCHAGVSTHLGPDAQPARTLLWGDNASPLDRPWKSGLRVVHGHYVRDEVDFNAHRIGIDTGAYFSGRLTALRIEATNVRILQT